MAGISRRSFLQAAGIAGISSLLPGCRPTTNDTKYIKGSWFEFQHHNKKEGKYWNATCANFSAEQWEEKIKEMAELGMEYLVMLCTALDFRSFYPTEIFPSWEIGCEDPVEVILAAADKFGMKFFISGGFYGEWTDPNIFTDKEANKKRLAAIEEIAEKYGHHSSFFGWYWPNEAAINPYFRDDFIQYTNECSSLARSLTPDSKILIAPYGTRLVKPDDNFIKQLDSLNVDIIAYQDEVGVQKSVPEETPAFFEGLRIAHDKVSKIALWADLEIFDFEGDVYQSALIPASFPRIQKQIEGISPYVDTILVYQYQGMMSKPGSTAYAGHPEAGELYTHYSDWLKHYHPDVF